MPADARPTVPAPDDDPHLWLEEIEGARALAWVEAQNSVTLAAFGNATFARDRDTLTALLDRRDHIPFGVRRGRHLYNFWRDANNPRGFWRRTTLDSFRAEEPVWEILLDVDALAAHEKEDWVWHGASSLPGTHERAIPVYRAEAAMPQCCASLRSKAFERLFLLARGKEQHRLAGSRHTAAIERLRQRYGNYVRLCENRAAMAAWIRCREGADADGDGAREHGPVGIHRSYA